MKTDTIFSQERYLSKRELRQRYNIGNSTVYDWIHSGILPQPYKVGPKLTRWKLSELEKWEEQFQSFEHPEGRVIP